MNDTGTGTSRSLARTLALAFIAMSVAAIAISGVVGLVFLIQTQKEAVAGKQKVVANQAADAVAGFIREKFSVMEAAVRLTRSYRERENAVRALLGLEPAFRQLLLLNTHNEKLFRVSRMSQAESERLEKQLGPASFPKLSTGDRYVGSVYVDQATSEPLVILSVPVTTILGDRLGILLAEVNLKFIWQLVDRLKVGETGHAYVVDRQGRLIAFGDTARVLRGDTLDHLKDVSDFIRHPRKKDDIGVSTSIGITGNRVVGTYVPLGDPDWAVMTELPVREAYRPVIRNGIISAIALLIMAAMAGRLGVFLARRLTTPIVQLTRYATRIADGELDVTVQINGPTEVIRLSSAFNGMTRQLGIMLDKEAQKTRELAEEIEWKEKTQKALEESERHLRELTANVPGVVIQFRTTRDHVYTNEFLSEKITEIFGLEPDSETILDEFYARVPDGEKDAYSASMREAIDTVSPWTYEGRFIRPDGETIWFSGHAIPHDEGDTIVYYGILLDITRRKEMESSLRLSQFIFDKADIAIFILGERGEFLNVNEEVSRYLGYSREELLKMSVFDVDKDFTPEGWAEHMADLRNHGVKIIETFNRHKNGNVFPIQVIDNVMIFEDQEFHVAFVQDITERKQMEQVLRESEERLKDLVSNVPGVVYQFIAETNVVTSVQKEKLFELFGMDSEPENFFDDFVACLPKEDQHRFVASVKDAVECIKPWHYEGRFIKTSGEEIWIECNSVPRKVGGKIVFYGLFTDNTWRKEMESSLRLAQFIIDNANIGIYRIERDGRIREVNQKAAQLLGYTKEELETLAIPDIDTGVNHEFWASNWQRLVIQGMRIFEREHRKKNGSVIPVEIYSNFLEYEGRQYTIAFVQDITDRKRAEESLRLTRFSFEKASVGIYRIDEDGRLLDVNEQACRNLGYTREELCRMTVFDIDSDYTPSRYADLMAKLRNMRASTIETRHLRKNGEIYPVQLQLNFAQYENQEFIVVFEEDITQRKRAQQALKESEQRLDLALSGANEGIWDWRIVEDMLYLDDRYYTMAGYRPHDFPARYDEIVKRTHPDDADRISSINDRYLAGKIKNFEVEFRFLRKDGSYMWIQAKGKIVSRDSEGNPTRFIGTQTDITDRKLAEKALRENEQLLGNILESMSEGVFVLNSDFEHTIFNSALETIGEISKKEVIGEIPWVVFPRLKDTPVEENIKETMNGEFTGRTEIQLPFSSGQLKWLRVSISPLKDENGSVIGIVGVVTDISQRKQYEEELQRLQNYLSNIINSMPSILIAVDRDGNVTQWNNQTELKTGLCFEEARFRPLAQVFPRLSDEMERIKTAIQERRVIGTSKVLHKLKQEIRFEDITIFPLVANGVEGAVIRVDDVTEQVRLEEMMIQSEKMLSVGGLAAGMAHEINNPLGGMMQTAEVMALRLVNNLHVPANQKAAEDAGTTLDAIEQFMAARGIPRMLSTINESGQRVAAIVENMLSFARKSDSMVSSHDLGNLLNRTLELANTDYDLKKQYDFRRILIERDYGDPPVSAPCEAVKIQQVLLNILRNGAQAMQEAGTESPRFILRTRVGFGRGMAIMEIEDNGPGMDEATRKRIFEPFFTTKPVGVGTGLGLSVSYFIITENHQGEMSVESGPGSGTKFIIRLPMKGPLH